LSILNENRIFQEKYELILRIEIFYESIKMDTQSDLEEVKINSFINDMNDTKQAVVNLLDTLKKMNLALSVIADNQNHLNSKLNKLILSKSDNEQDNVQADQ